MSAVEGLLHGFAVALSARNLAAALFGVTIGTIVGVLPGIGSVATMALLFPFTFTLDTSAAMIMLAGIYYGAMYGGSTTSILVSVPGEAASMVTVFDGYQMARKGRAGAALAIAAIGSYVAGTLGVIGLTFFAPALASAALAFGPAEYFSVCLLGLALLTRLTGGAASHSVMMALFGIALGTVGPDLMSGVDRFTFGKLALRGGIALPALVIGLFGFAEMLSIVGQQSRGVTSVPVGFRGLYPSFAELRRSLGPILRGSVLGFGIGLIPGPAPLLSSLASYTTERRLSRWPEEFGRGAIEGVAGPEAANNAATSGALVPLLALGLPFAPATAMLLGGFVVHGVTPGPLLMSQHPDVFWGLVASMYIGNAMLLVLNLPLVPLFASITRTPMVILVPLVVTISVVGTYSVNNRLFDVAVMLAAGVLGYGLRQVGLPLAPLVVGFVLGPLLEVYFRQTLLLYQRELWVVFTRPLTVALLMATLLIVLVPALGRLRGAVSRRVG
ncbi:MAG: tripartite tricarboxylate transporter permease [Armatimonadota bacterium]|nr:tripartite tricarboxylate transporter permease [Armatimonadota bacterium]MDR7427266.1 tripartite tricarboxylate transporter permease [Armatimonadota bacterium]MDR7463160.1 tripartite tricarboxylate transporter permease [Armatimonadota bacterium]MDR7468853.1 tripartite tricarboxylate transporter permease [Armatimonadota bacterium]MDR7475405.1 tripartite tricarboxylate transporter permease [Armatimonadota bacterium]